MQAESDEELMRLVRAQNRAALEMLYDRYVKLVYSFARKTAGSEQGAKEIVQGVFMRLWSTKAEYHASNGLFVNWLLTITRNVAIDLVRRNRKNLQTVSLDQALTLPSDSYHPEQWSGQEFVREQIREASRYLTERQAQLIELVYWKGYSLREIAEHTQEPIGTVKSRLHHALKILRRHLATLEEELL